MADNCGFCLELHNKYNCGWCQDQCDVQERCTERNVAVMWLNKQQTCPDPQITDFHPKTGPLEGGTNITIEGINLGRSFEDVMGGVHVLREERGVAIGLINCIPFREDYVKTSRIMCEVQSPNKTSPSRPIAGVISVRIQNEYSTKSKEYFHFVNPKITHIEPVKGPKSGGTRLNIWGLHMDAGSRAEAFLGTLPCTVTKREKNRIECMTSARYQPGEEKAQVNFDRGKRVFDDYRYLYVEDPRIASVESGSASSPVKNPRGIPGGGILISVKGTNLNAVQKPQIYVEVEGIKYNSSCIVESALEMKCKSPPVPAEKLAHLFPIIDGEPVELNFGFLMDDVTSVMDLSKKHHNPLPKFLMYPDPVYFKFQESDMIKYYKSDYLTINVSILIKQQDVQFYELFSFSIFSLLFLSRARTWIEPLKKQMFL